MFKFSDEVYLIDDRLYKSDTDNDISQEWSWSSAAQFNNDNFHSSQPVTHHNSAEHPQQPVERVDLAQEASNYQAGNVQCFSV